MAKTPDAVGWFFPFSLFFGKKRRAKLPPPDEVKAAAPAAKKGLDGILEGLGKDESKLVEATGKIVKADAPFVRKAQEQTAMPEAAGRRPDVQTLKADQKPVRTDEAGKKAREKNAPRGVAAARRKGWREFVSAIEHFGLGKESQQMIENLATMLDAGLPVIDGLKTLEMEARGKNAKQFIHRIAERVESGVPLWRSMDEERFFSPDSLALVRIGEEAGNLAENMQYLAVQQEKDAGLKSKVTMAMIYPAIVVVLMFVIVMGLGLFVLPNLIGVLTSLNVPLPFFTRMLIAFTQFFTAHATVVVPGSIGGFFLLAILGKFTRFEVVAQWAVFRIPGIGRLLWEATVARFGVIVGGLLRAGVPLTDALRSLAEVTSVVSYRQFYVRLLDHITVGDSFSKAFAAIHGSEKFLPISVQQLIMTGEKTGSLSKVLLKVSDIYEKKANDTAQKLPIILEPMLLIVIGSLVASIAFAIIIPIYSIVGSLSH